jgi:phosphoglycerate dehydrogenase-like enzyme
VAYAKAHGNLLLTPHLGGATVESMAMTEAFMADKLKRFLASGNK